MTALAILYGSRARGDERQNSDVDIILSESTGEPSEPKIMKGISLHFYPQNWLLEKARLGDLFVAHVALEGRGLYDPNRFLGLLRKELRLKSTYEWERRLSAAAVALLISRDWGEDLEIRRRYFWAIRTLGSSLSAEKGRPAFSNDQIENELGVPGLARHIANREHESFQDCLSFGRAILGQHGREFRIRVDKATDFLMRSNIGKSTVKLFETAEVQEFGATALYS